MPQVVPLGKSPDLNNLKQVAGKLSERHESLRTSFEIINGSPVQKIHPPGNIEIKLEYYETGNRNNGEPGTGENRADRVEAIIQRFVRPFDLAQAPLLRWGVIKTHPGEHLLAVDIHHIITDGISYRVLIRDFLALSRGEELPPLKLQYKDFSEWQNNLLSSGRIKKQEEYWLKVIENVPPVLNLPTDYPKAEISSYDGGFLPFALHERETRRIRKLAAEEGVTLFMIFMAVYNIFLSKISGQEDILVGVVAAGRGHTDLEGIIGLFINTLVLRHFPAKEKTFRDFLRESKKTVLEALENQEYQFEYLVEKLLKGRDRGYNPLFDVIFDFHESGPRQPGENNAEPGHETYPPATSYQYERKHSKFDLALKGDDEGGDINLHFEYRTRLFNRDTIERFVAYIKKIIGAVVENPGINLGEIAVIEDFLLGSSKREESDVEFAFQL